MEVECPIYTWTPHGMTQWNHISIGYIRKSDVERLLEEAHQRGKRQGLEEAARVIKETTP